MYHSFLIHSSADGHLGCFHVLAIINSAAMNTEVHMSLSDLVSLVCMPRPLQFSCLEDPMDRGAWWATVCGVTKSRTGLSGHTYAPSWKVDFYPLCHQESPHLIY